MTCFWAAAVAGLAARPWSGGRKVRGVREGRVVGRVLRAFGVCHAGTVTPAADGSKVTTVPTSLRGIPGAPGVKSKKQRAQELLRAQATQGFSPERQTLLRKLGFEPSGRSPGRTEVRSTGGPGAAIAAGLFSGATSLLGADVYTARDLGRLARHPVRELHEHPFGAATAAASVFPVEKTALNALRRGVEAVQVQRHGKGMYEQYLREMAPILQQRRDLRARSAALRNRPAPRNTQELIQHAQEMVDLEQQARAYTLARERHRHDWYDRMPMISPHAAREVRQLDRQGMTRVQALRDRARYGRRSVQHQLRQVGVDLADLHPFPPGPSRDIYQRGKGRPGHVPQGWTLERNQTPIDEDLTFFKGGGKRMTVPYDLLPGAEHELLSNAFDYRALEQDMTSNEGRKLIRAQMEHGIGGRPYRLSDSMYSPNLLGRTPAEGGRSTAPVGAGIAAAMLAALGLNTRNRREADYNNLMSQESYGVDPQLAWRRIQLARARPEPLRYGAR